MWLEVDHVVFKKQGEASVIYLGVLNYPIRPLRRWVGKRLCQGYNLWSFIVGIVNEASVSQCTYDLQSTYG